MTLAESLNLSVSFLTCQWEMAIPASATAQVLLLLAAGDIQGKAMAHAQHRLYGHTWLFNLGLCALLLLFLLLLLLLIHASWPFM